MMIVRSVMCPSSKLTTLRPSQQLITSPHHLIGLAVLWRSTRRGLATKEAPGRASAARKRTRRETCMLGGVPRWRLLQRAKALAVATMATDSAAAGIRFDNVMLARLPVDPSTDNKPRTVPNACFSRVKPTPVSNPRLLAVRYATAERRPLARLTRAARAVTRR